MLILADKNTKIHMKYCYTKHRNASECNCVLRKQITNDLPITIPKYFRLENVAINDVLPLKAARRDAIVTYNVFGASGRQRPNFDGFIYIHYAAHYY